MSDRTSAAKRRFVPASALLKAIGDDLLKIKSEDSLTWADIGDALHKSPDMAARYADGSAVMDVVSYLRGKDAWNGRFSGTVERLLIEATPSHDPQSAQTCILKAALALSTALEDGELTNSEIRANRSTLEQSRDAIDALLARLTPKQVQA